MLSDLACAIADGAEALSDFRVMGDQAELFGPVASVPTAWRTLQEIAGGGARPADRIATVVAAHSDKVGAEANFKGYDPTGDIHAGDEQTHRAGRSRVCRLFPARWRRLIS